MSKEFDSWSVEADGGWTFDSISETSAREKYAEYCKQRKGRVTFKKNGDLLEMRRKLDGKGKPGKAG